MADRMNEYQRYLIEEFVDEYHERHMDRRDLLRRTVLIMGSIPGAAAALSAVGCGGNDTTKSTATSAASGGVTTVTEATKPAATTAAASPSAAATAAGTPGAPVTSDVKFKGPASDLLGYLAKPAKAGTYPGVIIIHENRGLVAHTKDVARRYAAEGFVALAVDLVSRSGGTQTDEAQNTGLLGRANPDDLTADLAAYAVQLKGMDGVKPGGVGVVGFCFGGGYVWEITTSSPDIKAAVPYYGMVRATIMDKLPNIKAAVLAIYAGLDTRITGQSDAVKAALAKTGKPFDIRIFPNVNHAFFNDTGQAYNADAAKEAFAITVDWFKKNI